MLPNTDRHTFLYVILSEVRPEILHIASPSPSSLSEAKDPEGDARSRMTAGRTQSKSEQSEDQTAPRAVWDLIKTNLPNIARIFYYISFRDIDIYLIL